MGASTSAHIKNKMLHTEAERPCVRGGCGGSAPNSDDPYEENHRPKGGADNRGIKGSQADMTLHVQGVRVVSEAGKGKPLTAIIVARKATKRVSAGKRRLIQTKSTLRHDRDGTTLRVQGVP